MSGFATTHGVPLLGLVVGVYVLSCRYYTSASYERPIHLGILTFAVSAVFLSKRFVALPATTPAAAAAAPHLPTHSSAGGGPSTKPRLARILEASGADLARRKRGPFCVLVGALVARTLLFWLVVRTSQCAYPGVEAFLPFWALVCDGFASATRPGCRRSGPVLVYGVAALLWGLAAVSALHQARVPTATVCAHGTGWRPLTTVAQLVACLLDAAVLVTVAHVRRDDDDDDDFLATVLYAAALATFLVSFPTLLVDSQLYWAFWPHWFDVQDLVIDALFAAGAVVGASSLLAYLHPTTMALLVSSLALFGFHVPRLGAHLVMPPYSASNAVYATAVAAALVGLLCCLTMQPSNSPQPSTTALLHKCLTTLFLVVAGFSLAFSFLLSSAPSSVPLQQALDSLRATAGDGATAWASQAATSQSLEEAVAEYQRRYVAPPPPNFDKWYDFARSQDSLVIDDFDQIHQDLLPFWGVEARVLRRRTAHLLELGSLEMGGVRVRNGKFEQSPHVPGTHRWMLDSLQAMVEPFVQWLPDMDIALNLADECRMAVPHETMEAYRARAQDVRSRIVANHRGMKTDLQAESGGAPWPDAFPEPQPAGVKSPDFTNNIRWPIYSDLVAPACPPASPARNWRWWDWGTTCVACQTPHSLLTDRGALPLNADLAADMCHQPDLAYLDGFMASPSAMVGTNVLYPIFSQGRVGGFSDIMMPSPWNFDQKSQYDDQSDVPWGDKANALFWRGTSSDGYAAHGSWAAFLRARFVHEAHRQRVQDPASSLGVNVSFAGPLSKCHEADCAAELAMFRHWGHDAQPSSAPSDADPLESNVTPFTEHWRFRHLMDLDGAGFSGRFLPFLKSRSLVYRAALFQAWFDERLSAWHHYVPVDVRLGPGFWAVVEYFSGGGAGAKAAERVATQGREWAHKTLRREDMQVYMFRLLLEWGRVVSDEREHLYFEA